MKQGDPPSSPLRSSLPLSWIDDELEDLRDQHLFRTRRPVHERPGPRLVIKGRSFLNFSSNNYLDLAGDPRPARAAARAARRFGCGAGASPLVSGYHPPLRALERALKDWEQTQAALVFPTGFAANLALLTALAGPADAIFSDALNHASLIDGCRLSHARGYIYRHADSNHLKDLLRQGAAKARRRLIVTDSVFSMDGDLAPLSELADLARQYDALLIVDEAHATGVLGPLGRGLTEVALAHRSGDDDDLIKVGTLSKALGAQGGFVCGSRRLIHWLVNRARPYIFSTALAPPLAAAARQAVALVRREPERREYLLKLAATLRSRLEEAGFPPTGSRCQIVPIVVGDAQAALELSAGLQKAGILAPAIRPPSVPDGAARLRISLTSGHSPEDIDQLVEALTRYSHLFSKS
jgi:8-amino-7-oxononanoate synthase